MKLNFNIRPMTEADFPAAVGIRNATLPEYPRSLEGWLHEEAHREPHVKAHRWIAEVDGCPVAFAGVTNAPWWFHENQFNYSIFVTPDHQGNGLGSALHERLMETLQPRPWLHMRTSAREDMTRTLRFLADRGFVETDRDYESRLGVDGFDFGPYAGIEAKVRELGVEIKTIRELEGDPDRNRKLYEMENQLMQDVPVPVQLNDPSFEFFVDNILNAPRRTPDGHFLAVKDGEYIGTSQLYLSNLPGFLETGLTGVLRDWRRHGLALAMKLRAIAWARSRGARTIRTENSVDNEAMLSINERLGFVKQPCRLGLAARFGEEVS